MSAATPTPPLRAWLLTLLWLVLGPGMLSLVDARSRPLNLARLDAAPAPGTLHVVAVGTSKTRFALPFDTDLAAQIAPAGQRLVFHRFTYDAATFDDLAPVFAALRRQPPDWLLIEGDMLFIDRYASDGPIDRSTGDRSHSLQGLRTNFRDNLMWLGAEALGLQQHIPYNQGGHAWPDAANCLMTRQLASLQEYRRVAATWRPAPSTQWQAYVDALQPLITRGTRVVVLDLPRAPHATLQVPAALDRDVAVLRQHVVQATGYIEWSPGELHDDDYCDQGHLNASGRSHYTAWLGERIRPLLEDRP